MNTQIVEFLKKDRVMGVRYNAGEKAGFSRADLVEELVQKGVVRLVKQPAAKIRKTGGSDGPGASDAADSGTGDAGGSKGARKG